MIKWEKMKEVLIFGIITAITTITAFIIGTDRGERDIRREHQGYPFFPVNEICIIVPPLSIASIGTLYGLYRARKPGFTPAKRIGIFMGVLMALAYMVYSLSYRMAQPVEYYSETIGYGVYSRDQEETR